MAKAVLSFLVMWLPLVCCSTVRPLLVIGSSMTPALRPGQLVLLHHDYYRAHPLRRGDVVAFRWQGCTYVKRVYALPGEQVSLVRIGDYWAPAVPGTEACTRRLTRRFPTIELRAFVLPPGRFFCLGDNLGVSIDSRDIGPIPTAAILGRAQSLWGSPLPYRSR